MKAVAAKFFLAMSIIATGCDQEKSAEENVDVLAPKSEFEEIPLWKKVRAVYYNQESLEFARRRALPFVRVLEQARQGNGSNGVNSWVTIDGEVYVKRELEKWSRTYVQCERTLRKLTQSRRGARHDSEVLFYSPPDVGNVTTMYRAEYRGQGYLAKRVKMNCTGPLYKHDEYRYLLPQIEIFQYVARKRVTGVARLVHCLEVKQEEQYSEEGYSILPERNYRVALFEQLPPGDTLREHLERTSKFPEKEVLNIVTQICRIIRCLRAIGVYQWHLGPEDFWLTNQGEVILFDLDFAFMSETEFGERKLGLIGGPADGFFSRVNGNGNGKDLIAILSSRELFALGSTTAQLLGVETWMMNSSFLNGSLSDSMVALLEKTQYAIKPDLKEVLSKAVGKPNGRRILGSHAYRDVDAFLRDLERIKKRRARSVNGRTFLGSVLGRLHRGAAFDRAC